jgi:hypothetical protein
MGVTEPSPQSGLARALRLCIFEDPLGGQNGVKLAAFEPPPPVTVQDLSCLA